MGEEAKNGVKVTLAKMPTASIPQIPQMPWVMNVQQGSSKLGLLSRMHVEQKTMNPEIPPMTIAWS